MAKKALQAEQQVLEDLEDQAAARVRPCLFACCLYVYMFGLCIQVYVLFLVVLGDLCFYDYMYMFFVF